MIDILIFENQKFEIENTFNFINLVKFDSHLNFKYLATSQELNNIAELSNYGLIIIDIDLSLKSEKDGYGILKDIKNFDENILKKVFVLTGSTKVKEYLKNNDLSNIEVVTKPVEIDELTKVMKAKIQQ